MSAISLGSKNVSGSLLAGNVGFATSYEHIQSITVGSLGASSVSFTEIPQNYRHLEIRHATLTSFGYLRFNGDTTTSNYRCHYLNGNGTSASSGTIANNAYFPYVSGTVPGCGIMQILDYSNTVKNKTTRSIEGYDDNGVSSSSVVLVSNLWMSTAPITSINLIAYTSFGRYTTFSLYGVK